MRVAVVAAALLVVSCAAGRGGEGAAPHPTPIETACTADAASLADLGLLVRTDHTGGAQAKVTLKNAGGAPRRVVPERVGLCRGPCDSGWARCESLRRFEPGERSRYAVTLAPGESIELLVDARRSSARGQCEKSALFLIAHVDGQQACADGGAWVAVASRD
jgi:hypothetical protein